MKKKNEPKSTRMLVYLRPSTKKKLSGYAAGRGQTMSSVVDAAISEYIDDTGQSTLILRELSRIRRGVGRLEKNLDVVDAALAGYIQMWLAYNPPLPPDQKEAAQAMASDRFDQFIDFVKRQVSQNRSFVRQIAEDDLFQDEDISRLLEEGEGE